MRTNEKLQKLREKMKFKGVDAWIIPSGDTHQSEYLADHWKTRSWFSGFTGSAGICVVTMDKAGLWTDSRYWLQAEKELSGTEIKLFKMYAPGVPHYHQWLLTELEDGSTAGFDSSIMSVSEVRQLQNIFAAKKIELYTDEDLVTPLWEDRPAIPANPVMLLNEKYTGESVQHKTARVREIMSKRDGDYHLISALDEIAWLFNIRGSDIKYNPVVISFAFLSMDDICLFIDKAKLGDDIIAELENINVKFFPYDNIYEFLSLLPSDKKLLLDPQKTSAKLKQAVNCQVTESKSIITTIKGIKNATEQAGIKKAHIIDGVALCRWVRWITTNAGKMEIDEYQAGEKLEYFREMGENYQGPSFSPIVGYKDNGAVVHYSAKKDSAKKIEAEGLLLVDSGGQYLDGTTDVTRTISLGKVTEEERYYFTLVLAGHISLARAIFPRGTSGAMLDTYSRTPLWREKLNYGHGTGHGVGHFLCVHEGPQSISPKSIQPVLPGSVTSNEPGIYLAGKFGIRIENMIIAQELETTDYGVFCHFKTVTMCPICRDLVDKRLLTVEQIEWLNAYHQEVYETLSSYMDDAEKEWLKSQTLPL